MWLLHVSLFVFQAKKAKQADIERKRAEVRKRLEETAKAKKAKKGFMTPERKKKLRVSSEHVVRNCFPSQQFLMCNRSLNITEDILRPTTELSV
jgi:hypothetical protein